MAGGKIDMDMIDILGEDGRFNPKFSLVIECALRYALERESYVVEAVGEFIRDNMERLGDHVLDNMVVDISDALSHMYNGNSKRGYWYGFRNGLREEIGRRKTNET